MRSVLTFKSLLALAVLSICVQSCEKDDFGMKHFKNKLKHQVDSSGRDSGTNGKDSGKDENGGDGAVDSTEWYRQHGKGNGGGGTDNGSGTGNGSDSTYRDSTSTDSTSNP